MSQKASTMPPTKKEARIIMGENFIGLEETEKHLGKDYSYKQLESLGKIPYPKGALLSYKETSILFPGYPLNVEEMISRFPIFNKKFHVMIDKYKTTKVGAELLQRRVKLKWYLMRKAPRIDQGNKTYDEHMKYLKTDDLLEVEMPYFSEMLYMMIITYIVKKHRLLGSGEGVRCKDIVGYSGETPIRATIGSFTQGGIFCSWIRDDDKRHSVGTGVSVIKVRKEVMELLPATWETEF